MLANKTVVFFSVVERKVKHAKKRGNSQAAPDQNSEYKVYSMKKCGDVYRHLSRELVMHMNP